MEIVATDLDIVFYDEITDVNILKEGSTTTSATIIYDILRKISSNSDLKFELKHDQNYQIVGKNGAGKSTLLNYISFNFDGTDFNSAAAAKIAVQTTGMVSDAIILEAVDMTEIVSKASTVLGSYSKPGG